MEVVEDIVIAGAGLAGLSTALGLHRLGVRSLVLESSEKLRAAGFGLLTWSNAWKALDVLGISETLHQQHIRLQRIEVHSLVSPEISSEVPFEHEIHCLKRSMIIEALAKELPKETIRFSSKVVNIEEFNHFKLVHLADGTVIKTKVLIGCDGINSLVAKWLGLDTPVSSGRTAIRAFVDSEGGHGLGPVTLLYTGNGFRAGFVPCDDQSLHWFLNCPPINDKEIEENPGKLKQYVLNNLGNLPDKLKSLIENTQLENIYASPMRYRRPWTLLWGNISKGNVCVAGDALHPMTPELGQGGCSALEDGIVLARCLAEAFIKPGEEEWKRIEMGLEIYAKERRWRSIELIFSAYTIGFIQQSGGKIMTFLRSMFLNKFMIKLMFGKANFDVGKLKVT